MRSEIISNDRLAPGYYRMALAWRATGVEPGQFVMLRVADGYDPLLRRPFGIYNVIGPDGGTADPEGGRFSGEAVEVVYRVVGRGTTIMSEKSPGEYVDVLGPLGRGFTPPEDPSKAILVGGGMGVVPLHLFARVLPGATLLFGARGSDEAALAVDFSKGLDLRLRLATDDGSVGRKGFVTDLLEDEMKPDSIVYACGPPAMLRKTAEAAAERGVECYVSLERSMACGIGVCLGCAVKTGHRAEKDDSGGDYRMVCSDGPVFDAAEIDWGAFNG